VSLLVLLLLLLLLLLARQRWEQEGQECGGQRLCAG
jgi:hypothetical protein